jgi:hypothetical protein
MTEPDAVLDTTYGLIGGPLPLACGRRVWAVASAESVDPIDPEPVPAGTMIEPMSPIGTTSLRRPSSSARSTSPGATTSSDNLPYVILSVEIL